MGYLFVKGWTLYVERSMYYTYAGIDDCISADRRLLSIQTDISFTAVLVNLDALSSFRLWRLQGSP